ncbi:hypothetical protein PanWU01x14_129400 [Parasponia andersonii]|uniref:Uncharacterized protein n=1 Tax=Parasponia andersonii TaxID=3476 RepID=A0A2P5CRW1_PARAD|nr:hypothetical protein PanWU01x14_129400 [Parasponia andersonii]
MYVDITLGRFVRPISSLLVGAKYSSLFLYRLNSEPHGMPPLFDLPLSPTKPHIPKNPKLKTHFPFSKVLNREEVAY